MPARPRKVPPNPFIGFRSPYQKNAIDTSPGEIIHPFYRPTKTAELAACSQEMRGRLMEGRRVFPVLSRDGKNHPIIQNRAVVWDTVKGANQWIQTYAQRRAESVQAAQLPLQEEPDSLITPSKLHKLDTPLVGKLLKLFGTERSQHFNSASLDSLVDEFVNDGASGVFCEDVYLYLLQHHVNSVGKLITIIDSIVTHMVRDIDQMQVAENLILQILFSFDRSHLDCTPDLVDSFDRLIAAINDRFHTKTCEFLLQPLVAQCVLDFYITAGKLSHSKKLFAHLILKGRVPREEITVKFLQLVDHKIHDNDKNAMLLKKFAYISDFRPLIVRGQRPALFAALIPYCRHFGELFSLLTIITTDVHNTKEVLDVVLLSMIRAATKMGRNKRFRSANLYELYRTVLPYYSSNLPAKFTKEFVLKFAGLENWSAVASLLKRQPSYFTPDFIAALFVSPQNGITGTSYYPGGVKRLREIFIWDYVRPQYSKMSRQARLSVCGAFDTPKLFADAVSQELGLVHAAHHDIMSELIQQGHNNGLLKSVPSKIWNDILNVPGLTAALESLRDELELLRQGKSSY